MGPVHDLAAKVRSEIDTVGAYFFAAFTLFLLGGAGLAFGASFFSPHMSFFYRALAGALVGGACFTAYEAASLWRGWTPITEHTRRAWHEWPKLSGVIIFLSGAVVGGLFWPDPHVHGWWVTPIVGFALMLLAHFFWGPPDTKPAQSKHK